LAELAKHTKAAEAAEQQSRTLEKDIVRRIRLGGTTGDRLKDYVIRKKGSIDFEAFELYQDLEDRLANHVGEPIIVICRGIYLGGVDGPTLDETTKVGVVPNSKLLLERDYDWSISTDAYAVIKGDPRFNCIPLPVTEGNITTETVIGYEAVRVELEDALDAPLNLDWVNGIQTWGGVSKPSLGGELVQLEIAIGADEVQALLDERPALAKAYETVPFEEFGNYPEEEIRHTI
jgi:hypothetical protein